MINIISAIFRATPLGKFNIVCATISLHASRLQVTRHLKLKLIFKSKVSPLLKR